MFAPVPPSIDIQLSHDTYKPGDLVTGTVRIALSKHIELEKVTATCIGLERCCVSLLARQVHTPQNNLIREFYRRTSLLAINGSKSSNSVFLWSYGNQDYHFSFQLGPKFPPSMVVANGRVRVVYKILIEITPGADNISLFYQPPTSIVNTKKADTNPTPDPPPTTFTFGKYFQVSGNIPVYNGYLYDTRKYFSQEKKLKSFYRLLGGPAPLCVNVTWNDSKVDQFKFSKPLEIRCENNDEEDMVLEFLFGWIWTFRYVTNLKPYYFPTTISHNIVTENSGNNTFAIGGTNVRTATHYLASNSRCRGLSKFYGDDSEFPGSSDQIKQIISQRASKIVDFQNHFLIEGMKDQEVIPPNSVKSFQVSLKLKHPISILDTDFDANFQAFRIQSEYRLISAKMEPYVEVNARRKSKSPHALIGTLHFYPVINVYSTPGAPCPLLPTNPTGELDPRNDIHSTSTSSTTSTGMLDAINSIPPPSYDEIMKS